jgi:integrase
MRLGTNYRRFMPTRDRSSERPRGNIEARGSSLRVRVSAGDDPVTGKPQYLRETVKGVGPEAWREAKKVLRRLTVKAERDRKTSTGATLSYVLDEWFKAAELDESTRETYAGYIARTIKPALGEVSINKLGARALERFYSELRRCRARCSRPIDDHTCRPLAASTVRQIHSIISGALSAAVRWEWIETNPARGAARPRAKVPEPSPPSAADAARLLERAFEMDADWGVLVWLAMTTGARRGELCALRWSRVDLDEGVIDIRKNYRLRRGVGQEKDTKTHQMRRIALDTGTVALLSDHRARWAQRLESLGLEITDGMYVFTGARQPVPEVPYSPHGFASRYKTMATRLGIDTHLHQLRHYSATELLNAGVDLRTVAGRLGHGGGGATTLKVYAAWVAASDRKAAELLGARMPKAALKQP